MPVADKVQSLVEQRVGDGRLKPGTEAHSPVYGTRLHDIVAGMECRDRLHPGQNVTRIDITPLTTRPSVCEKRQSVKIFAYWLPK